MTDLDLGMNDHMSEPFDWDDTRKYNRGKVLSAEDLESIQSWGRYRDVDGDGIPYRTLPGTHPTKGSYFTRGSSHDENAAYSEDSATYVRIMDRLKKKLQTATTKIPVPVAYQESNTSATGMIFFGTSRFAAEEAIDILRLQGIAIDAIRLRSFPFQQEVLQFIDEHDTIYVIEQNRDAQMRALLINELEVNPKKMKKVLNYDGFPITADLILQQMQEHQFQPLN